MALVTASILIGGGYVTVRQEDLAASEMRRLAQRSAEVLAGHLAQTFETVGLLLRQDPSHANRMREIGCGSDGPLVCALFATDAAGTITYATSKEAVGQSAGDHAWFRALRSGDAAALHLDAGEFVPAEADPCPARGVTPCALLLARAIGEPMGEFRGAAVALLSTERLAGMLRRDAAAFGITIRLRSATGLVLAHADGQWEGTGTAGRAGGEEKAATGFAVVQPGGFVVEAIPPERPLLRRQAGISAMIAGMVAALGLLLRQAGRPAEAPEVHAARRAKEDFLAVISHEIRTPISGIIGTAELLQETGLDRPQRRYVEALRRSAEHLLTIVNDILDLSKLQAGAVTPERRVFSPEAEVAAIVDLFAPRAAEKGVELICTLAPDLPAHVTGDPKLLRQLLFNLVGNAVKFTEHGWIHVALSAEPDAGGGHRLSGVVADTGIGLDPAKVPLLFERFTQADASTARRYGGTGLGLAICREIVGRMGGSIEAAPRAGGGSVFRFDIRLGQAEAPAAGAAPRDLRGLRILVVGDLPPGPDIQADALIAMGAEVKRVSEGEAALAALRVAAARGEPFGAILLDDGLPDPDRLDLARRIRREAKLGRPRLILCVPVSGMAQAAPPELADVVLPRPVLPAHLYAALAEAPEMRGQSHAPSDADPSRAAMAMHATGGSTARCPGPEAMPAAPPRPAADAGCRAATARRSPLSPEPIHAPVPPGARAAGSKRVLLVEDNATSQLVLQARLQQAGVLVDLATDGEQAMAAAERTAYDAIVMDVQMPVMDGLEATRRIRRSHGPNRRVRIIGLTAALGPDSRRQCREAGMDDCLGKPASRDLLLRALGLGPSAAPSPQPSS